jgi:capsular exopolysaccharide synthesis family protein
MEPLPSHLDYLDRDPGPEIAANPVREALRVLRKQWVLVLVPMLCVLAVVYVMTKRKPPIYEASTRLNLEQTADASGSQLLQQILAGNQTGGTATQVEILRSPELLHRAVPRRILAKGMPQVAVVQVPDTDVVDLTVWWENANECAEIANLIAEKYRKDVQQKNRQTVTASLSFVRRQLDIVQPDLRAKSLALKRFQEQNSIVELPLQTSQAVSQLAGVQDQIRTVQSTLQTTETKLPDIRRRLDATTPEIEATRTTVENPLYATLEARLQELQLKRADLLIERVETSPAIVEIDGQIANVKSKIRELFEDERAIKSTGKTLSLNPEHQRLSQELATLETDRLAARAHLAALRQTEARQSRVMQALPKKQYELANLQRDYQVLDKAYQDLMQQKQSLELAESAHPATVEILRTAAASDTPVSPNVKVNMMMAAVLGTLLGVGLAFVREYMSDSLDTAGQVATGVGLPVIGTIPSLPGLARGSVLKRDHMTPEMEGYHFVASALPIGHRESSTRTLLLTSAGTGQGNSTTVANLAAAFAQRQKAVVLVDLDLRKPTLHALFDIAESPGISDVIAGRRLLAEALHPTSIEGLLVMPAGSARENPIRTLSSAALTVVLQDLANVADVVLIDSPPCVTVTDASIIAPATDGTILLLRAGEADRHTAQRAKSILNSVGASLLGVILNRSSGGLEGFSYTRRYGRVGPPALGPGA